MRARENEVSVSVWIAADRLAFRVIFVPLLRMSVFVTAAILRAVTCRC